MTVTRNPNDLPGVLEQLQQAEPDPSRSMLTAFVQALMSADADAPAARSSAPVPRSGRTVATAIGLGKPIPGPARSSW